MVDGKDELDGFDTCPSCRAKVREVEWREERLARIPEAERGQKLLWYEQCNLPAKFEGKTFGNFVRRLDGGSPQGDNQEVG